VLISLSLFWSYLYRLNIFIHQSIGVSLTHLSRLPSCHSPLLYSPFAEKYTPNPCYLPFSQSPSYLRPSGQINVPFPLFLSSWYWNIILIVYISYVFSTISPSKFPFSLHFIICPFPNIFSPIGPSIHTLSMNIVVKKISNILWPICPIKLTFSFFFSHFVFSIIFSTIWPSFYTISILFILLPFPFIASTI